MNESPTTLPSSPVATSNGNHLTIRELSTERRLDWIERIFARLHDIYGQEFAYKWGEATESTKQAWIDALAGFNAAAIGGALKACEDVPKCPNLPDFKALCRAAMPPAVPMSSPDPEVPMDKARVVNLISEVADRFSAQQKEGAKFSINGVPITPYKRWAYALILREADGEQLANEAAVAWREVLGFSRSTTPQEALKTRKEISE